MCSDKKCQGTKYYKEIDKNCPGERSVIMHPVKPKKDVQLKKLAMKLTVLANSKNCQATICDNTDVKSQEFWQELSRKWKLCYAVSDWENEYVVIQTSTIWVQKNV